MSAYDEDRGIIFNERIRLLKDGSYRGFHLSEVHQDWDGFSITAKNDAGKVLSTTAETQEEAFQKMIDKIDVIFD